jgi:hypothetical protein
MFAMIIEFLIYVIYYNDFSRSNICCCCPYNTKSLHECNDMQDPLVETFQPVVQNTMYK